MGRTPKLKTQNPVARSFRTGRGQTKVIPDKRKNELEKILEREEREAEQDC